MLVGGNDRHFRAVMKARSYIDQFKVFPHRALRGAPESDLGLHCRDWQEGDLQGRLSHYKRHLEGCTTRGILRGALGVTYKCA